MVAIRLLLLLSAAQEDVQKQIDELKQEVQALRQERSESGDLRTHFKNGFTFESGDGAFKGSIGGRIQADLRFFLDGEEPLNPAERRADTVYIRRARLGIRGTFYEEFSFKVEAGFGQGAAGLRDAFVNWRPMKEFAFRAGQMKEPFSMEELTSTRFIDMIEYSLIHRLVPARDLGVAVHGVLFDDVLQYEVGFYGGAGINLRTDENDDKDVAARVVVRPLVHEESMWARGLQFGAAVTHGNQEAPPGDIRTASTNLEWLDYVPTIDADGARTRVGLELAWLVGPFGLKAEYHSMSQRLDAPTLSAETIGYDGFYIIATYWVTGEDETFGRPKVAEPLTDGGPGAWELGLRFSSLDVENDIFGSGFATRPDSTDGIDELVFGVNWWPIQNARVSFNYVHTWLNNPITVGRLGMDRMDSEDAVLMRFQIDF